MSDGSDDTWSMMHELSARTFGRRPSGREHRVVVDHELLATCTPEGSEWERILGYLGLDQLDSADERVPAHLRKLLRCATPNGVTPRWATILMLTSLFSVVIGLIVSRTAGWISEDLAYLAFPLFIFGLPVGLALLEFLFRKIRGTPTEIRDAALRHLVEHPFIVTIGDLMVENLPGHAWLRARRLELREAHSEAKSRRDEAEALMERIQELRQDLGLDKQDAQVASLQAIIREEKQLMKRIERVERTVRERLAIGEASLESLRKRAELAALQSKASGLTGQEEGLPERVAADVELETSDLRDEWKDLSDAIADEETRWSAIAEVHAAS